MQRIFGTVSGRISVLALFVLCAASSVAQAQSRDARIVSAQAGGVNYVSGSVNFKLKDEAVWNQLTTRENLESGDAVRTGAYGRVEVLLSPGSYLRVGENAEFELADASLDSLRIRLLKGSAVVEATGYGDMALAIDVDTPHTQVSIIRTGIYRINVLPSGISEVIVRKGRALVGRNRTLLKGERMARFSGASDEPEIAKLDKKNKDDLDVWSKERAGELASANRRLPARTLNPLLASMNFDSLWINRASRFQRTGFWIFNPRARCYTFLPFYGSWSSPYGGFYDNRFVGNCHSCGRYTGGNPRGYTSPGGTATIYPNPSSGTSPNPSPAPAPHQTMPRMRDTPRPAGGGQPARSGPTVRMPRDH